MGRNFLWGAWAILMFAFALGALIWRLSRPGPPSRPEPLPPLPPVAESAPAPPPTLPPAAKPPAEPAPLAAPPQARTVGRRGRKTGDLFIALRPFGASVVRCARGSTPAASGPVNAILVLDIESLEGRVKIVGASPFQGGNVSEALVRCAQSEMVGREVAVASARPGQTYKMPYSIRY